MLGGAGSQPSSGATRPPRPCEGPPVLTDALSPRPSQGPTSAPSPAGSGRGAMPGAAGARVFVRSGCLRRRWGWPCGRGGGVEHPGFRTRTESRRRALCWSAGPGGPAPRPRTARRSVSCLAAARSSHPMNSLPRSGRLVCCPHSPVSSVLKSEPHALTGRLVQIGCRWESSADTAPSRTPAPRAPALNRLSPGNPGGQGAVAGQNACQGEAVGCIPAALGAGRRLQVYRAPAGRPCRLLQTR